MNVTAQNDRFIKLKVVALRI